MSDNSITETRSALFRDRNFRWLGFGAVISFLGDQFSVIALPWLVLKMTGDPLAMGLVIATMSIPRMVFILLGGAFADRYSAKRVLIWNQCFNGLLLGLLGLLVFTGSLTMWMVYGLAVGLGIASAFSMPAWNAIVPQAIPAPCLPVANSMFMSAGQASALVGPLLAGVFIAWIGDGGSGGALTDAKGLGAAFMVDFCSFILSLYALSHIRLADRAAAPTVQQHLLKAVAEGVRHFWNDRDLRVLFIYGVAIMLFVGGPIQAAMPVLAEQLNRGAAAFGVLTSAYFVGSLSGILIFGLRPNFRIRNTGTTILLIDLLAGLLLICLGQVSTLWQGVGMLLGVGLLGGFVQVMVQSWTLQRVPYEMVGRVMSVLMFVMMSAIAISIPVSGWLLRSISPSVLYVGSGCLLVGTVLFALTVSSMRRISDTQPSADPEIAEDSVHA